MCFNVDMDDLTVSHQITFMPTKKNKKQKIKKILKELRRKSKF